MFGMSRAFRSHDEGFSCTMSKIDWEHIAKVN
jgi:hypothetical protein